MATDEVEAPLADMRRALHLARKAGDLELELDALVMVTRFDADTGAAGVEDFRRLAKLSVESGRWATASEAARMEAMLLLEETPAGSVTALDRAEEVCLAHGLTEELAWTNYARVELRLLTGAWDGAVAAALAALALAEPNGYRRAAVRVYYALLPIASARGEDEFVRRAHRFSERARPHFPAVPAAWARVMSTAAELHFGALRLPRTARYAPDEDACLPAFDDAAVLPSWCAAVEMVLESWRQAGHAARVEEALERAERAARVTSVASQLWLAAMPLERARLHAGGSAEAQAVAFAREAVTRFRRLDAVWWLAKGLRLLVDLDAAPAEDITELGTIERRLGLAATPRIARATDESYGPTPSTVQSAHEPDGGTMATASARKIFVNLAVADLGKAVEFFTQLGFSFDQRFTDEHATCMIISEEAFVMLLVKDRFKDFTKKEIVDSTTQTEAILALSAESREAVDDLVQKALTAGGKPANDPMDLDSMYSSSFQDLDGHH